tara:strand:+ start:1346 stop:1675 length:330 start_codon:yes stop_codon:yes gene_type:complete
MSNSLKKLTRQVAIGQKLIGHDLQLPEEYDGDTFIVRDCHLYEGVVYFTFIDGEQAEFSTCLEFVGAAMKAIRTPGTPEHKHEEFFAPLRYVFQMGFCDHNGETDSDDY